MAIKKSELYSSLWSSCDELRGGMDASQYKDYVLVLLFVKYVSDKAATQKDYLLTVPARGGFAAMVAAKGDKEIGDRINKIIGKLADANDSLKGAINVADFNDEEKLGRGKEMVDRLTKLVAIFEGLDFGGNRAEGDDLLGDAYEYLMRHFATESGKSKGQFYTPAEVSRTMSMVIDLARASRADQNIYDPTCGSGSLLLKAHDEAKGRTGRDLALYGQEMDNATSALARMNMVLHDCPTAEIWQANTLSSPHFKNADGALKTFDFVVANFPFSNKNWTSGLDPVNDLYGRFEYGIPPAKNGDYAFLLHILTSLKSTGKGAVVHPHGVLFRGGAEAAIRKRIVRQGYIKGIIGLPANLFYGTSIPACILVLDKEGAAGRKGIFMVDASKGFIKDGNKNRLRAQDIHKIVDTFTRQLETPKYSRMVPLADVEANDFNLNLPRYIDSTEPEDLQDIEAHLKGGIPNRDIDGLSAYWQVFPNVRRDLFADADRTGYSQPKVEASQVKAAIFGHAEFTAFNQQVTKLFGAWKATNTPLLTGIKQGDRPKVLIESVSESLLETFRSEDRIASLIDPYGVYQHLMDYWVETMQDDAWMIASDGWKAIQDGKPNTDLIPSALIVTRYFAAERADIEQLEAGRDAISREMEEMDEEHGGEDGLLAEGKTDKGKLSAKSIKDRLKAIKGEKDVKDELKMLEAYAALIEKEAAASKKLKEAQKALDTKVAAKYKQLSAAEIKTLVVEDKWLTALATSVHRELDRVSQALTGRIKQLAERYVTPLPKLAGEVETLAARVDQHLKKDGVRMEVTAGFKKTEVGVIPDEWEVRRVGDLGDVVRGGSPRPAGDPRDFNGSFIPWLTVAALTNIPESQIRVSETVGYLTEEGAKHSRTLSKGTLIITNSGATLGVAKLLEVPCCANDGIAAIINQRAGKKEFVCRYINSRTNHLREVVATGNGQPNLNTGLIRGIAVPFPSAVEQRAIATTLSDVDVLITTLDLLIAKKRDLKQAAMQQLLTGQTRLPGFHGEWEVKRLGDTATLKARIGWQGLTTAEYLDSGDYYLVTGTEFKNGYIDWNKCHYVNEARYKQDKHIQLKESDVLVTKDGTIGKVALVTDLPKPATLNSGVFVIRPIEDAFHSEFFYYLLCSTAFTEFLVQLSAGSTINHLYQKDFVSFVYKTPATIDEQTAIATILSDMDAEIAALEARRDKVRVLKQGMMQELLTGRIRLV